MSHSLNSNETRNHGWWWWWWPDDDDDTVAKRAWLMHCPLAGRSSPHVPQQPGCHWPLPARFLRHVTMPQAAQELWRWRWGKMTRTCNMPNRMQKHTDLLNPVAVGQELRACDSGKMECENPGSLTSVSELLQFPRCAMVRHRDDQTSKQFTRVQRRWCPNEHIKNSMLAGKIAACEPPLLLDTQKCS